MRIGKHLNCNRINLHIVNEPLNVGKEYIGSTSMLASARISPGNINILLNLTFALQHQIYPRAHVFHLKYTEVNDGALWPTPKRYTTGNGITSNDMHFAKQHAVQSKFAILQISN